MKLWQPSDSCAPNFKTSKGDTLHSRWVGPPRAGMRAHPQASPPPRKGGFWGHEAGARGVGVIRPAPLHLTRNADGVRQAEEPLRSRHQGAGQSARREHIQDLQKKAARLGGDGALVALQSQGARGGFGTAGGGFRVATYTTAEVYRCEGAR